MNNSLQEISEIISDIDNLKDQSSMLIALKRINELNRDNGTSDENRQGEYLEEKYRLLESAYRKAVKKIREDTSSFSDLLTVAHIYDKAADHCKQKAEGFKESRIAELIRDGDSLAMQGKYKEAVDQYDKTLKLSPSSSFYYDILVKKGTAYYNMNDTGNAKMCYEEAENVDRTRPKAIYSLGLLYENMGELENALMQYKKAIEIDEYNSDFFTSAGYACWALKRFDDAKGYYTRALELDPRSSAALNGLGAIYNDGYSKHVEAQYFYKALKFNPDSLMIKLNLAEIEVILKNFREAEMFSNEVSAKTDDQQLGFVSRVFLACIRFLNNEPREKANTAVIDTLTYYRSIPNGVIMNWEFEGIRKIVQKSEISTNKKEVLLSLFSLAKLKTEDEKEAAIQKNLALLRNTEGILSRALGRDPISKLDIRIENTYAPVTDRPGWYLWEIFLDVSEDTLSQIASVKYTLHPTFVNPERIVRNKKERFSLKGQGWGEFRIKVDISTTTSGETITRYHWLRLGPTPLDKESIH